MGFVVVAVAAATVVVMLYVLAALIRDQVRRHDLTGQIRQLRREHEEQIADVVMAEEDDEITRLARERFGGPMGAGPAAEAAAAQAA